MLRTLLRTPPNSRAFVWSAEISRPGLATDSRVYGDTAGHLAEILSAASGVASDRSDIGQ